jgi:signal transduction histidine kinase
MAADKARIEQDAIESERRRILTEMHDIIAHSLAVMVAQADGGSFVSTDPEASKRVFETIAETGRAAVDETRRVLGMLSASQDSLALQPVPDQHNIDHLVHTMKTAGMNVYLIRLGELRTVPAGLGLALYRICQEALTNAMRHAGEDTEVTVTENWKPDEVIGTITNTVNHDVPQMSAGSGMGVLGMKERAAAVGGTLAAGVYEDGFRVRLVLPVPDPDAPPVLLVPPKPSPKNLEDETTPGTTTVLDTHPESREPSQRGITFADQLA